MKDPTKGQQIPLPVVTKFQFSKYSSIWLNFIILSQNISCSQKLSWAISVHRPVENIRHCFITCTLKILDNRRPGLWLNRSVCHLDMIVKWSPLLFICIVLSKCNLKAIKTSLNQIISSPSTKPCYTRIKSINETRI